jgi:hypothetical protein
MTELFSDPEPASKTVPLEVPGQGGPPPVTGDQEFLLPDDRGRWGWYKLKDPKTGAPITAMRATTLAGTMWDRSGLEKWKMRMTAVGLAQSPDLMARVYGKDVKRDRDELNWIVDEAKERAGGSTRSNLGTAMHSYLEYVDGGLWGPEDVPTEFREDVSAYLATMASCGLEADAELIERITYVSDFDVAGKFDRIFRLPDGSYIIGDLKTGDSLDYSAGEFGVQFAIYAHGVNTSGIWSKRTLEWTHPIPRVREDIAVIVHLPVGSGRCTLHYIDIKQGWKEARMSYAVRASRRLKGRTASFSHVSELPEEF